MKKALALTTLTLVLMGLAACATPQASSDASAQHHAMNTETTLQAYHWTLKTVTAKNQAPVAAPAGLGGRPLILNFSDLQVSVGGLCNALNGGYRVNGSHIAITRPVSTMKACADAQLMRFEQEVGQHLPTAQNWSLNTSGASPALVLTFEDGTQWNMTGEPTAATRYGGEPQRVFLEVAPQRVACSHPLMPNYQCLNVREITYDDQGLKTGAGEWTYYYGTIEGYEHQAGVRNILRINRYTRKNQPADASKYADILDMVVESETVMPSQ